MDKRVKRNAKYRRTVQVLTAFVTNIYLVGFIQGKIYRGKLKQACVPGFNCYSCPGAIGSCPIGSLQAVIGSYEFKFSYYIVGFLVFVGALVGRFVCGWLCPFGLFQDLLYKIPFVKKINTFKGDKILRNLKYVILVVFVILMPLFLVDIIGQGPPYFCKLICPAGTLEGGIPLVLLNKSLQQTIGWLYAWKMLLLVITIILCMIIFRAFCKYICPLGAIYSLFNSNSILKLRVNEEKCTHCHACSKICRMNVDPVENPNDKECIRCGKCKNICSANAISFSCQNKNVIKSENNSLKETVIE